MQSKLKRLLIRLIAPVLDKQSMTDKTSYGNGGYGGHAGTAKGSVAVGLGILVQISQWNVRSNIIVKSALRLRQLPTENCSPLEQCSCFLRTCHFCNKVLSLDKEVYMYRGDLGFCSIKCRNRQIVLDETRELEAFTKKMIASYRSGLHCRSTSRRRGTTPAI